jgi:hypothetical protein
MGGKKTSHEQSGFCFDSISITELRRLMDEEGIGSLCRGVMERIIGSEKGKAVCLEFARKMTNDRGMADRNQEKKGERNPQDSNEHQGRNS